MPADAPPPPRPPRRFEPWHLLLVLVGVMLVTVVLAQLADSPPWSYSQFRRELEAGRVAQVVLSPDMVRGTLKPATGEQDARPFRAVRVEDPGLLERLQAQGVEVAGEAPLGGFASVWPWLLGGLLLLPSLLGRLGWGAGAPGAAALGTRRVRVDVQKDIGVTFADVEGVDEAKEELAEVVEFLRTPEKFRRLGGRMPHGVLLVGPPGTGKTLLARAVAGEAKVPFFRISGSEFVEMFVGVGAARVRDLFEQARAEAPCIVFIDELDALGRARGASPFAHEEREQTLNQLLVELDGFDPHANVVLMAATNRPEILDPALLRAGRFDRQVLVDRPDRQGRLAVLRVHARQVALEDEKDLEAVAAMTAGMVGADMANLVNEAALLAARRGKEKVGRAELEEAVERVVAGLEKRNRVLSPKERERVAHHEVGHALVSLLLPGGGGVKKISVIPRGISALGYTLQQPTEDRFLMTHGELEDRIAQLLGGRVAEELVYREVSTGAQDDLARATRIARSMVEAYGMSDVLGPVSYEPAAPLFLQTPGAAPERAAHSEALARRIDLEVQRVLLAQQERVRGLLGARAPLLRRAATALLARETLTGEELQALVSEDSPLSPWERDGVRGLRHRALR